MLNSLHPRIKCLHKKSNSRFLLFVGYLDKDFGKRAVNASMDTASAVFLPLKYLF